MPLIKFAKRKHQLMFFWFFISLSLLLNAYVILRSHTRENVEINKMPVVNVQLQRHIQRCQHLIGQPASRPPINPYAPGNHASRYSYRSYTPYEKCIQHVTTVTRGGRCDYGVRQCDMDAMMLGVGGISLATALMGNISGLAAWISIGTGGAGSIYAAIRLRQCYKTHCQKGPHG